MASLSNKHHGIRLIDYEKISYIRFKGVARIFGRGSAIWSEATDSALHE